MGKDLAAVFNMLLDPASAVERVSSKWIWVYPLALMGVIAALIAHVVAPLTTRIMLRNPPDGVSREQLQQSVAMMEKFSGVGMIIAPIAVILGTLIVALLVMVACQVMGVQGKFKEYFNLVSMASIVKVLGSIAAFVVLKLKADDIQTTQELSPPFGLDIFLPDDTNKMVMAAVNFFSIFEIWFLVVLAIGLAAYVRCSKGKAFAAITPAWLFPLLFVVIGAAFRRG